MNKKPLNILVVDDDKNFAHTLCEILKTEGYNSVEVHSVDEAQDRLKKEHFDCVLSDVKMPDKSGPDLYKEIKDDLPNLPFILMTAYTSSEVINDALESGVLTALHKPINISEILAFFSKLSQNLQAAIICEDENTSNLIKKVISHEKFTFTLYKSISQLINSIKNDYSIVFVDTQKDCEHYSSEIKILLEHLPKKTIVIICNYAISLKSHPQKLNLITLPREDETYNKIDQLLYKKLLQHAKESIQ